MQHYNSPTEIIKVDPPAVARPARDNKKKTPAVVATVAGGKSHLDQCGRPSATAKIYTLPAAAQGPRLTSYRLTADLVMVEAAYG